MTQHYTTIEPSTIINIMIHIMNMQLVLFHWMLYVSLGEKGEQGEKGERGLRGPPGAVGQQGTQGDTGAMGRIGEVPRLCKVSGSGIQQ